MPRAQGLPRVSSSPEQWWVQRRLQGAEPMAGLGSVLVLLKVLLSLLLPL